MRTNFLSTMTITSLVALLAACGGASSPSSESGSPSGVSGGSGSDSGNTSTPTTLSSQVSLVDGLDYSVTGDVQIWWAAPTTTTAVLALETMTEDVLVTTCTPESNPLIPCLSDNGKVDVSCEDGAKHLTVKSPEGELLAAIDVDCAVKNPVELVANRDEMLLYSVDSQTNEVVQHRFDAEAVQLVEMNRFSTGASPQKIAYHPTGNMIYVLNQNDKNVSAFHISGQNGDIEEVGARIATGLLPQNLLVHPTGRCVYVNNAGYPTPGISSYSVSSQGLMTALPPIVYSASAPASAMTLSHDGLHAYVATAFESKIRHYTVNPESCVLTLADTLQINALVSSMTVDEAADHLYLTDLVNVGFFSYGLAADGSLIDTKTDLAGNFPPDAANPTALGQILLLANETTSVLNGGDQMKGFEIDASGVFAYSVYKNSHLVEAYLVTPDCQLIPFATLTQGGDTAGIIVNMVPLAPQQCSKALSIPEGSSRIDYTSWIGSVE